MAEQFETFLNFNDEDLARFVADKLNDKNVEVILERSKPLLDPSLVDTSINPSIHIKLKRKDFHKGNQVLEDYYKTQVNNVDPGYYLLSFTDDELKDVISKPDEWGHFDYQLAQKLLKERGHGIEDGILAKLKEDRLSDLARPEKAGGLLLLFGYFFVPFGVVIGFFIGHHLFYNKKPLPTGQLVFTYREVDRRHGKWIIILAGVLFIVSIIFFTYRELFKE